MCYEAGYEGFWLARYLAHQAPEIEVVVLDLTSLQIDRRAKKVKTDRMDARRIIRALKAWHSGDSDALSRVRVPSVEEEDRRRLIRERDSLLADRQQGLNRTKGLLYLHGIFDLQPKARDLIPRLIGTPKRYGEPLPPHTLAQIGRIKESLAKIDEHIAIVENQRCWLSH